MTDLGDSATREDYLTGTELAVLAFIEEKCQSKMGTQWWSLRRIGEATKHSPSTVLRAVHVLERTGHIKITHGPGGGYGYEVLE